MRRLTPVEEARFWAKVDIRFPDQCWIWTGTMRAWGVYGVFSVKDLAVGRYRAEAAHRVSYYLCRGGLDEDLDVCHLCDQPLCVNPWHLHAATHDWNMADMAAKGRAGGDKRRGEDNPFVTMDEDLVREAFRLYNTGQYTQVQVARGVGISQGHLAKILTGQCWAHLGLKATFHRRLEGLAEQNAAKTHCPKGHPYEGDNLSIWRGRRCCKACGREKQRAYQARKRESEMKANV